MIGTTVGTIDRKTPLRTVAIGILLVLGGVVIVPDNAIAAPISAKNVVILVDSLSKEFPADHRIMQSSLREELHLVRKNVFSFYEARDFHINGISIDLADYREPPASSPVRGPYLSLTLNNDCIEKDDLMAKFSNLVLLAAPSGHSPKDLSYYGETMPWGKATFGFSQESPECLRNIILDFKMQRS